MEDKCKPNFDLHVCHQLLNTQARISRFLSARAKEKKTTSRVTIKLIISEKHQTEICIRPLKFFIEKFRPKRGPRRGKSVVFRWLRNERDEKRFSHTHMGVWVRVCRGSSGHMVFQSPVIFVAMMRCKRFGEIE